MNLLVKWQKNMLFIMVIERIVKKAYMIFSERWFHQMSSIDYSLMNIKCKIRITALTK